MVSARWEGVLHTSELDSSDFSTPRPLRCTGSGQYSITASKNWHTYTRTIILHTGQKSNQKIGPSYKTGNFCYISVWSVRLEITVQIQAARRNLRVFSAGGLVLEMYSFGILRGFVAQYLELKILVFLMEAFSKKNEEKGVGVKKKIVL